VAICPTYPYVMLVRTVDLGLARGTKESADTRNVMAAAEGTEWTVRSTTHGLRHERKP
jgi:hypothetical protein